MRPLLLLPLLWLVSLVACSGVQTPATTSPTSSSTPEAHPPTTLEVKNEHQVDVDIYVLDRTQRLLMGTAPARRTVTLVIPPELLEGGAGRLRFKAEALGSDNLVARDEEMLVREGEQLSLRLR